MMNVDNESSASVTLVQEKDRSHRGDLLEWPYGAWLCAAVIALVYLPVVNETAGVWFRNDNFAHGIYIIPLSVALVWLQREQISQAKRMPVIWGLLLLALGLAVQVGSYLLRIKYIGIWTLIPVLVGAVLVLHGKELWRITRFPIWFLFWAGPLPSVIYASISGWVQTLSTKGAADLMSALGYTLLRIGNEIQIPGYALEVAEACSGFKKLIALIAFALLYGYLFHIGWKKRLILLFSALPIALLANVLRVSVLIAVFSSGGPTALHHAHDLAEFGALILSFVLFVQVGRILGCKTPRFSV